MEPFVDFVTRLIYATGGEAVVTPNHRDWLAANPAPNGAAWFAHHVDAMLPAFEAWLSSANLPPLTAWDGTDTAPWVAGLEVPLDPALDGSFTGVGSVEVLGQKLRDRFLTVGAQAQELGGAGGMLKAPFSYRYWGYMKWAALMRDVFNGVIVVPPGTLYDRDGTVLSAIPFLDVFNDLHRNWHVGSTVAVAPTPGYRTSVGQRSLQGGVGLSSGEEFIRFHRDHVQLHQNWLARSGQPAIRPINMGHQWPQPADAPNNPSTWTQPDQDPWINAEGGDTDNHLQAEASITNIGNDIAGYHGTGHVVNTDIASLPHNNYVPRFFSWHGWIDSQWFWREPHFALWNPATGLRERTFTPVLSTGADWPGLPAVTIVRDPAAVSDSISPANAVSGLDFTTGAGTLRMKFFVKDPYGRNLTLKLKADVFNDAVSTTVPTETIPEASNTYLIGAGGDFALETPFTVDFTFATAFQSDDPPRANPAVGFVNSRIRISGTLEAADGSDPNFIHEDFTDIDLVREKSAPQIDVFLDLSTFGEDQVNSAMSGGVARFSAALIVTVQDRTSVPAVTVWPTAVADEVKGLLSRPVPASGLFDDAAHAPSSVIWQDVTDAPFTGLTVELASGPDKEDPSLPDNLPQRFTYKYDVVFAAGNTAFDGLAVGGSRFARLRLETADRSGNDAVSFTPIELLRAANPYMRDGSPSWLSIDTRVFRAFAGDTKFGASLAVDQPNTFIGQVIANLNSGATGGDTFDALPTDEPGSALEYSTEITNFATGVSTKIYNFALAKVRLQGAGGAANVRAFFRVFRYSATNLIFNDSTTYRFADDGAGKKIPLAGYSAPAPGGDLISIPFFAEPRVAYTADMTSQADAPNVQSFPAGSDAEQVLYYGAFLDINQDSARLPSVWIVAHPDGGFATAEVQTIRTLMSDAHQCMVVEIRFDDDPTPAGATPADSDNLAQRNLMILTTDNPGDPITHTVEHSFEVNLGDRRPRQVPGPAIASARAMDHGHTGGMDGDLPIPPAPENVGELGEAPLIFVSSDTRRALVREDAMSLAMFNPNAKNMDDAMNVRPFLGQAAGRVDQRFPLVFDGARWQNTTGGIDELMFQWNGLPKASHVELYLPGISCEQVVNLRNLRHAPGNVRIVDSHTLQLIPDGPAYVPLPPVPGGRLGGVVRVALPAGIRKGQRWHVDVLQLRGGERRATGGFQMSIQVSQAQAIFEAERRFLDLMFARLSLTPRRDKWRPILERRVDTIRRRAKALAESAGAPWTDPTVWTGPDGNTHPFEGPRLRVVLEKIQVVEDHPFSFFDKDRFRFQTRVRTRDNGVIEQVHTLPERGAYPLPKDGVLHIGQVIFDGYAATNLGVQVTGTEKEIFEDARMPRYVRLFGGPAEQWFGDYAPGGGPIDPEDLGSWKIWYRIERA